MQVETELRIDSIAAGGDGVGRTGELVVFVPRTAPGDVIRAKLANKGRFARGVLQGLKIPSPDRRDPPCHHYTRDRCGGCQIQHMTYESQLSSKQRIIVDALQRIARRNVTMPDIESAPDEWRYRAKLTLTIRRTAGGRVIGLHRFDDPGSVFQMTDCPITDERVVAVWREIFEAADLLPDASEVRGSVRLSDDGAVFVLSGGRGTWAHEEFIERVPSLSAVWWAPDDGTRRLLHDRRQGDSPDASFAQVNPAMAVQLRAHVLDCVQRLSPSTVVDGYAGAGEMSESLARAGATVTAIELDADAAHWCAQRLPAGSRAIAARVEDALGESLPADVVLLNPPRIGLHERVPTMLEAVSPKPKAVIYTSCNPATLARDLERMPGYTINSLRAFDMFPQTAHVETVCELVPAA